MPRSNTDHAAVAEPLDRILGMGETGEFPFLLPDLAHDVHMRDR